MSVSGQGGDDTSCYNLIPQLIIDITSSCDNIPLESGD